MRPTPAPRPPRRMVKPPSIIDRQKQKEKPKPPCCSNPKPEPTDEGQLVCMSCFVVIRDAGYIVNDVQFTEDASGRATAQGGYVTGSARHANTLGAGARRLGGSDRDAGQNAAANASKILGGLCPRLSLNDTIKNQAVALYQLASNSNFCAGRRTDEVVAACLYAVCRRSKDNQILLIDISELQRINVFRLGEVYKALCKEVYIQNENTESAKAVGDQKRLEVENLIYKYCRKLEFGDKTRQVAEDASRILRRMKRDWIVTGRHPAGLCGACIIYAARMNNFRRTKREMVYVAKIADQTISLRMHEFQQTRAASMSVEQFRAKGELVKEAANPPAIKWTLTRRHKFDNKKRKISGEPPLPWPLTEQTKDQDPAAVAAALGLTVDDFPGARKRQRLADGTPATPPTTQQEPRFDDDGFAVPRVPASMLRPTETGTQADIGGMEEVDPEDRPKKRGRKPKPIWIPSEDDLVAEADLEQEIQEMLDQEGKPDSLREAQEKLEQDKEKERQEDRERQEKGLPPLDREKLEQEQRQQQRSRTAVTFEDDQAQADDEPEPEVTKEALEAEFADDPEVMNCILPDREQKIKEQIWVTENEDWMRVQVAKDIKNRLNQEHRKEKAGRKGVKGRKKKGKMGDGSTIAEATTPIETPLDANRAMFERRGMPKGISKHINYEALKKAYGRNPSVSSQSRDTSEAPTGSRAPSTAPSEAERGSDSPTPAPRDDIGQPAATQRLPGVPAASENVQAPRSPPQTQQPQEQATTGAQEGQDEDDDDGEGDPDDYVQQDDAADYGSDDDGQGGWLGGDDDDREDIGEDEYGPLSRNALPQYADDDDEYD